MSKKYWDEAVREAFESANIKATDEQILEVVEAIEISHDCYGMAYPDGPPDRSSYTEIDKLKNELEIEKRKICCRECDGYGVITTQLPFHSATSSCWKCKGAGRHPR